MKGGSYKMNIQVLESLPEVINKYKENLEADEITVFTSKLNAFGTDKDRTLGGPESTFTLTNKRIIVNNGKGTWDFDLMDDVIGIRKYDNGKKFIMRTVYYVVDFKEEVESGIPGAFMKGMHLYLDKKNIALFDELLQKLI